MARTAISHSAHEVPLFLEGGGSMGAQIRSYDWASTALGPVATWPQSLRAAVSICLNSNFPIAIYWGTELTLLYNDAWSPIPGSKHPWALGKPAREVWPEIWDAIEPQFQKAFLGEPGGSKDALLPMQRHGYTEECYFDFTFTPVHGETGNVEGIFNAVIETTFRIISERRTTFLKNLALKTVEANTAIKLLETVIDFISEQPLDLAFAALYQDNNLLRSSRVDYLIKEQQVQPWPFEQLNNKPLFIERIADYFTAIPGSYWPEPITEACMIPLWGNDDARYYIVCGLSARRRFDEDYRFFLESVGSAVQATLDNITALEIERRKTEALQEIDRAKTTFFTNISHEFRTPLTLILGALERLQAEQYSSLPESTTDAIQLGYRNATRLLRLVNNLLDFSRLEAGKARANFQRVDVAKLTKGLADNFSAVVEQAGLSFTLELQDITHGVYLDKSMWEKIVLNLLSNAFKYTLQGSISLSLSQDGNMLQLQVQDTGVGIPASELPHMFERFHRVENNRGRSFEGTGIGLSLVRELVQFHGGNISVASEEGKGSAFTVTIPVGSAHLPQEQIVEEATEDQYLLQAFVQEAGAVSENSGDAALASDQKDKVLVVDDNADMRKYISSVLQPHFNVLSAAHGAAAIQLLHTNKVDLVLSDMMMPVMDGAGLLRAIRNDARTAFIPFILLTARAGEEARVEGFDIGADDYLVKPFSANELQARVRSQIRLAKKRSGLLADVYRVFDEVPFAVAVLKGPELIIEYINQYNLGIWQTTRDRVLGKPLFEARPDIKGSAAALHEQIYATGQRFEASEIPITLLRDSVPETRYFDAVIDPMRDEHGSIIGQLATSIEVTEKVLARRAIEQSEAKLRDLARSLELKVEERTAELSRSNEDLQQFAHVASHDLKEPVRKIMMFAKMVETGERDRLSEAGRIGLEKVQHAADRMMNMVNGVLAYSQLSAEETQPEPINLEALISSTEADLELLIHQKEATIIRKELPQILGTPVLIHQLFYNLINNALKFTLPGIAPKVIVAGEGIEDGMARISVSDNGIGFEQEYAERIFHTFSRLNSKDKYEGTGLGLSLCRKIVERHGGSILAEGQPNKGARFTLWLPAAL